MKSRKGSLRRGLAAAGGAGVESERNGENDKAGYSFSKIHNAETLS